MQAFPAKSKNHTETKKSFRRFLPPGVKPKYVYTDIAPELKPAFDELDYPADTETPHRPETNGVAERAERRVKEGTSCGMMQSGWDYIWWDLGQHAYCFLWNVVDEQRGGHTSYYARSPLVLKPHTNQ